MVIVKVVYMNGKETEYNVDYPKAYIAKIMESENDLTSERKTVAEIYAGPKLIAEFIGSELRLVEPKPKNSAAPNSSAMTFIFLIFSPLKFDWH